MVTAHTTTNTTTTLGVVRWRLWIGGSSGLSQTYCAAYPNDGPWIWLGHEPVAPRWIQEYCQRTNNSNSNTDDDDDDAITSHYIPCDLVQVAAAAAAVAASHSNQRGATPTSTAHNIVLRNVVNRIRTIVEQSSSKSTKHDSDSAVSRGVLDQVIVGIRPPLVTHSSHVASDRQNQALCRGLRLLIQALVVEAPPPFAVRLVLHISSIAAIHHIQRQHVRQWTPETDPSSVELNQPYDRFKRSCEEVVHELVTTAAAAAAATPSSRIRCTSLRLGAIFSDHATCIQCSALALQCYTGPYLPVPIDCNSSWNVAHLIHLILQQQTERVEAPPKQLRPVYYYTRCVSQYPQPVPYGEYLLAYHSANHHPRSVAGWCRRYLWVPHWLVHVCFVVPFHFWTTLFTMVLPRHVPYLESIDYLLQVTINEHTFDMTATVEDFSEILRLEETMEACFQRRRRRSMLDAYTSAKKCD